MTVLLDTHAFIWFLEGNARMSLPARRLIQDETCTVFLSLASIWEMAIKDSLGKLRLTHPFGEVVTAQMARNDIRPPAITMPHLVRVSNLSFHHRHPFVRLIITQALTEDMPVVSADSTFDAYGVRRIW